MPQIAVAVHLSGATLGPACYAGTDSASCKNLPMELDTTKTTFLLGAGASVEAGLPISSALTQRMAATVDGRRDADVSRAINAAIGAMVAHDTARGRSAYEQVDIERLFSAIEMLSDLDDQELTPFVTSWTPAVSFTGGGSDFPHSWVDSFLGRLGQAAGRVSVLDEEHFKEVFAEGVRAVTGGEYGAQVFKRLQQDMLFHLVELLTVDLERVDYLTPLLNSKPPIRIATLNYDTTIEDLAWRSGRSYTTGLETWEPSADWQWGDASIRLLKLHGSLTWYWHPECLSGKLREIRTTQITRGQDGHWHFPNDYFGGGRGVVFGRRGKLRADGPYLAMLRAFDSFLEESDTLVIVGYSLRDDHINSAIARWFNRGRRALVLIDPFLPAFRPGGDTFAQELLRAIHEPIVEESKREMHVMRRPDSWRLAGGHQILRLPAGEALASLLGAGPSLPRLQDPPYMEDQ